MTNLQATDGLRDQQSQSLILQDADSRGNGHQEKSEPAKAATEFG